MDNKKYVVDRIEGNVVVLEDMNTLEIVEVLIDEIDFSVSEGNILIFNNNKYVLDSELEKDKKKSFRERLNRLKSRE